MVLPKVRVAWTEGKGGDVVRDTELVSSEAVNGNIQVDNLEALEQVTLGECPHGSCDQSQTIVIPSVVFQLVPNLPSLPGVLRKLCLPRGSQFPQLLQGIDSLL